MAIKENKATDEYEALCDGPDCGVQESADAPTWQNFINYVKGKGWRIVKTIDGWKSFCCDKCRERYMQQL